jgi:hypothetical protein
MANSFDENINDIYIDIVKANFPNEVSQDFGNDDSPLIHELPNMFDSGFVVLPFPMEVLEFWRTLLGFDDDGFISGNDI